MTDEEIPRGLDHLMEQNATDLPFLASYGAEMDGMDIDVEALFSGVETFLASRRVDFEINDNSITYHATRITKHEEGLLINIEHDRSMLAVVLVVESHAASMQAPMQGLSNRVLLLYRVLH